MPDYRAATDLFNPEATPTDIFMIRGSSSSIVRITQIVLSGVATAASNVGYVSLVKRSTVNSGGTVVPVSEVKLDSGAPTSGALARAYTADPTLGTLVGTLYSPRVLIPSAGSQVRRPTILEWDASMGGRWAPFVLNSASEAICVNMGGNAPLGAAEFQVSVLWSEHA